MAQEAENDVQVACRGALWEMMPLVGAVPGKVGVAQAQNLLPRGCHTDAGYVLVVVVVSGLPAPAELPWAIVLCCSVAGCKVTQTSTGTHEPGHKQVQGG